MCVVLSFQPKEKSHFIDKQNKEDLIYSIKKVV